MARKKRKKKRRQEIKASSVEQRAPAVVAQPVQPAQATVKYESGLDAILRRARERALQQLRERDRAVGGR